jgi:hypothetical protein
VVRNQTVTAFSFSFWIACKYLKSNHWLALPAFNHDDAPLKLKQRAVDDGKPRLDRDWHGI